MFLISMKKLIVVDYQKKIGFCSFKNKFFNNLKISG